MQQPDYRRITGAPMKRIVSVSIICLFLASCLLGEDEELGGLAKDDSIIAYYPLNGDARDMSGNGHDGNNYGATPDNDHLGNAGKGMFFNGGSSYIEIPVEKSFSLSSTDFTVSVWMNYSDVSVPRYIFQSFYDNIFSEFVVVLINSSSQPYMYLFDETYMLQYIFPAETLASGTWFHLAWVYNGNSVKTYINGTVRSEFTVKSYSFSGIYRCFIGTLTGTNNYFFGILDELAIFGRALSENEIQKLYEN